jgi:hypothetical protein
MVRLFEPPPFWALETGDWKLIAADAVPATANVKSRPARIIEDRPRFLPGITAPPCRHRQARAIPRPQRQRASVTVVRAALVTVLCSHIIRTPTYNKCTGLRERLHPAAERLAA